MTAVGGQITSITIAGRTFEFTVENPKIGDCIGDEDSGSIFTYRHFLRSLSNGNMLFMKRLYRSDRFGAEIARAGTVRTFELIARRNAIIKELEYRHLPWMR